MTDRPLYAGFDLGTTNSAAAVFDGERITVVRNAQGSTLTPSVVRIDAKGRTTVGTRAQRYLDSDPENTRSEFKRLMGTDQQIAFAKSGVSKKPEELSAEVLKALRQDVLEQIGIAPLHAVISVPALFELPQSSATSEAARLAGFEEVELMQEPIASALASGWTKENNDGRWLVYDLGGGTFDVSLLEGRDGLLRVVGHDGDNFLGGRDFDGAVVDWAMAQIEEQEGITLSRERGEHAAALKALKLAAEEAKIELSRAKEAILAVEIEVEGKELELELEINREILERLCSPMVDRSIEVCRRLLATNDAEGGSLEKAILVGGPTVMPFLRERISVAIGTEVADGHDPMTIVAEGAALYAATAGLDGRPKQKMASKGCRFWLQYPAVSTDLSPHVVGRAVDEGNWPETIRLTRDDGLWIGAQEKVEEQDGAFIATVELLPRRSNVFQLEAFGAEGERIPVDPPTITIVQGLTVGDPPLSRSIGVALANDAVRVYFERGAPLPTRRSFVHHTVESVAKGSDDSVLKIPIVQGEYDQAHLCRLVGSLEISGRDIKASLSSGAAVELTLELDRGGRLSARALVPDLDQIFEQVAHLLVPDAAIDVLEASLDALEQRLSRLRTTAFQERWTEVIEQLTGAESELDDARRHVSAARGGDTDAGQRARRTLIELEATLEEAERAKQWPELELEAMEDLAWAADWVQMHGSETEKKHFEQVAKAAEEARQKKDLRNLQRQLRLVMRIGSTCFHRHPEAWRWLFERAASDVDTASDLPKAQRLVERGRGALETDDRVVLQEVTEALWKLMPVDVRKRQLSYDSGVK